jgi:NitT/TauT family transport system substrate-binding protein
MLTLRPPLRAPRVLLLVSLLLALGALLGGSWGCSDGKGGGRVKLVLNWVPEPEFGGFYAARETGAFQRAGLDVELVPGGPGVPVLQMVSSGQAEFGIAGGDEVILARARGADVIPLFAVYQTSPLAIMAHASRGAKGIGDVLTSGTLAVEPGAPYVAFLKKKFGFDKVAVVPYDGGVARFLVEKELAQQCYITSEPIAAKRKGADPQVFLVADAGYLMYATVLITRKSVWKESPDRVRAVVRAVREGWRAYLDDPGPANAVMAKLNTTMDAETFREAAAAQKPLIEVDDGASGRHSAPYAPNPKDAQTKKLGQMTRERWEKLGNELRDIGVIEKVPPVDEYFFPIEE